jgi:hypothetical protein
VIYVQQMSGIVMPQPRWRLPSRQPRTGDWLPAVSLCIDDFTSCASSSQNRERSLLGHGCRRGRRSGRIAQLTTISGGCPVFVSRKSGAGSRQVLYSHINSMNCHMTATLPR